MEKEKFIKQAKRIVIKIGSQVLDKNDDIDTDFIKSLADQISAYPEKEFIIVSSGAVLAGVKKLKLPSKPKTITEKQAVASVGQAYLMQIYDKIFSERKLTVGQMLLTVEGLQDRKRYLYAKDTLNKLIEFNVVPIINENDAIAVEEIVFGDNDYLAAHVSVLADADLMVIVSTAGGLYTDDPSNPEAKLIEEVEDVDSAINYAKSSKSKFGTGGMRSKLEAAKVATSHSIPVMIVPKTEKLIHSIFSLEKIGTFIHPSKHKKMSGKKSWLALLSSPKGRVVVDKGAEKALKEGKSLLPGGIKDVEGIFNPKDTVAIVNEEGIIIGKGIVKIGYKELKKIKGLKTEEASKVLGKNIDEVIHRDNLVIY
ncbi:MAG: glutamate 5-kinase [Sulfurihydrogenibium sp.]